VKIWKGLLESLRPMIRPHGCPSLQRLWTGISRFGWSIHGYRPPQGLSATVVSTLRATCSSRHRKWRMERVTYVQTLKIGDVANPLIINWLWLATEAALIHGKGREVVWLRVFKDQDWIIVALSKYLMWFFLQVVYQPRNLGFICWSVLFMESGSLFVRLRSPELWLVLTGGGEILHCVWLWHGGGTHWQFAVT